MKNFLLVGNGAREHAVADAICKNNGVRLFAFMGAKNPGIVALCDKSNGEYLIGDICNGKEVAKWAISKGVSLAFPSPDAVLEAGVVDALERAGIKCAAPVREAARIEWDKAYARELMRDFGVEGCPRFGIFEKEEEAASFIRSLKGKVVVKPVGLTGGKGVRVAGVHLKDEEAAILYAKEVLQKKIGGKAQVVLEEKLEGEEFTLQAFSDGKTLSFMPLVQDHKLAYVGEKGPNTGGMGSYSQEDGLLPFVTDAQCEKAKGIMRKVIAAFEKKTSLRYRGVLYGQFMLTKKGPMVIEFNARFGDPEAMNVLSLLKSDLYSIFEKMSSGTLGENDALFEKKASVCKYLVPEGYPIKSITDQPLKIDEGKIRKSGARICYASVYEKEGIIYTQSSRSIGVMGFGKTIFEAEKIAEGACAAVEGKIWHREDIGTREFIQKKVEKMKGLLIW
ncbi:phosphoribosylamine--glycine ligase [Candidatus Micrarchaeota archaeon]|nr:phosphoribosylamine--glycine ligase [Candidatus Micrarchaeota archaeon]